MIGILHRDLSNANVMYSVEDGEIHGVLLDFDLAVLLDKDGRVPAPMSEFRTGTPAFMAIDLLKKAKGPHLFRYDLESFLWVLIWYACNHEDGERLQDEAFPGWFGFASDSDIAWRKREILKKSNIHITDLYAALEECWIMALNFLLYNAYLDKYNVVERFEASLEINTKLKIGRKILDPVEIKSPGGNKSFAALKTKTFTSEQLDEMYKINETLCGKATFESFAEIIETVGTPDDKLIMDPVTLL